MNYSTADSRDDKSPGRDAAEKRVNLLDLSVAELSALCLELGEKPYRGRQLAAWLFRRGAEKFDDLTDVSKAFRQKLAGHAEIVSPIAEAVEADDGGARKILWRLRDGQAVESVIIPEKDHLTLCVSSQVGCALGCRFCRTGRMGFIRNLTPSEIVGQIMGARKIATGITNIVFMGMGEPLLNVANVVRSLEIITDPDLLAVARKRVSVSTVGIIPSLPRLAAGPRVGLTISLSSAINALRDELMPINKKYPLAELKKALIGFPLPQGRRLTIAYVLLRGVNDDLAHARKLHEFLHGLPVKINLIPFNAWPGAPYQSPAPQAVNAFRDYLSEKNHTTIIRHSKGRNVNAACGQLITGAEPVGDFE